VFRKNNIIWDKKSKFEYVSQRGTTQQWRSASQALEVVWKRKYQAFWQAQWF
jgi:hypothetical protein